MTTAARLASHDAPLHRPSRRQNEPMNIRCWLLPTFRTLRLAPLLGGALGSAIVWALTAAATGEVAVEVAMLGCGAMAAAVSLALDDPAHELLAASPTSERRRMLQRLGMTGAVALAGWLATPTVAALVTEAQVRRPTATSLVALAVVGVAGVAALQRRQQAAASSLGAAIPLAWVASRWFVPESLTDISSLWLDRPLPVAASAFALLVMGART